MGPAAAPDDWAPSYRTFAPGSKLVGVALNSEVFLYHEDGLEETVLYISRVDGALPDATQAQAPTLAAERP